MQKKWGRLSTFIKKVAPKMGEFVGLVEQKCRL